MSLPTTSPDLPTDQPPTDHRFEQAVALAGRIHQTIGTLRTLDLTGIAPASVYRPTDSVAVAPEESSHAAL